MLTWNDFVKLTEQSYFTPLLSLVNIFLIFLTVLITYLAWRASKKANELQLMPLVAIYFKGKALHDRTIWIKNIGKGPVYDIKMESFVLMFTDINKIWELNLSIKGTNILIPKEEKVLELKLIEDGKIGGDPDFIVFHLDPEEEHKRKRVGLGLIYRDAEGNTFHSEVETGLGGLFVKPPKKINSLNIIDKLSLFLLRLQTPLAIALYKLSWKPSFKAASNFSRKILKLDFFKVYVS